MPNYSTNKIQPTCDTTRRRLVNFVLHQQRTNSDELGFLPRLAITEYAERNQIIATSQNGDLLSYALFYDGRNGHRPRKNPHRLHVHQISTIYEARLLHHATNLINTLYDLANQRAFTEITAWVANDIPANEFWQTIGFTHVATRRGGKRRNRLHNLWLLKIEPYSNTPAATPPALSVIQ